MNGSLRKCKKKNLNFYSCKEFSSASLIENPCLTRIYVTFSHENLNAIWNVE